MGWSGTSGMPLPQSRPRRRTEGDHERSRGQSQEPRTIETGRYLDTEWRLSVAFVHEPGRRGALVLGQSRPVPHPAATGRRKDQPAYAWQERPDSGIPVKLIGEN